MLLSELILGLGVFCFAALVIGLLMHATAVWVALFFEEERAQKWAEDPPGWAVQVGEQYHPAMAIAHTLAALCSILWAIGLLAYGGFDGPAGEGFVLFCLVIITGLCAEGAAAHFSLAAARCGKWGKTDE